MKMNLKTSLSLAGVSALMLGGFSLVPASAAVWGHDIKQDRNDLRSDRRDARQDNRDLRQDHRTVGRLDNRLTNQIEQDRFGAARHTEARIDGARRDIHQDKRDLQFDKRDLQFDRRDINSDKRDLRRDW